MGYGSLSPHFNSPIKIPMRPAGRIIYGSVRYIEIIIYHRHGGGLYVPKIKLRLQALKQSKMSAFL